MLGCPLSIDSFYTDPDKIRQEALALDYTRASELGGSWPGARTQLINNVAPDIFGEFTRKMYAFLGWPSHQESYFETSFQACGAQDGNSWIHQDDFHEYTHVGVIYLHPQPSSDSGTLLYNIKPTIENVYQPKGDWTHMDDNANFKFYDIKKKFENVYNKAVIYSPAEWHKSDTYFGKTLEDSRLTQVYFFRKDGAYPHHMNPPGLQA
jgi:hypothetical protein